MAYRTLKSPHDRARIDAFFLRETCLSHIEAFLVEHHPEALLGTYLPDESETLVHLDLGLGFF